MRLFKNIQNRMLKRLLFCVFVLCNLNVFTQSKTNLITNSSFEEFNKCPTFVDNIIDADYWFKATNPGSPDYFNPCATFTQVLSPNNFFGFQSARTGNAYAGISEYADGYPNEREYIETQLKQPLDSNKSYCISFYVSLAEISRYAIANIGFYFSKDSVKFYGPISPPYTLTYTPVYETSSVISDTTNWTLIQTSYTAVGKEKFITIGTFKNDLSIVKQQVKPLFTTITNVNEAYYYIDDVSVIEINNANAAIKDSLISRCFMDSVILGTDSTEFATYTWNSTPAGLAALSCTNCPNPIAKPLVTTKYYLTKQQQCSSTTKDSVTVVVLTPTAQANAGNDKTICIGDWVQLGTSDSLAFTNYVWQNSASLSCVNCAMPFANPNVTTTYTVQRTECTNVTTDTVKIIIDDCDPTFVLPNVFTPNGDEINDTWGVNFSTVNSHIKDFKMSIYDRWGLLVYSTNYEHSTPNSKWDGRTTAGIECKEGVYFYVITFNKNDEEQKLNGRLSLFR